MAKTKGDTQKMRRKKIMVIPNRGTLIPRMRRYWCLLLIPFVVTLLFIVFDWSPMSTALRHYRSFYEGMTDKEVFARIGVPTHGSRNEPNGIKTSFWEFEDGDVQLMFDQDGKLVGKSVFRRDVFANVIRNLRNKLGV